MYNVSSNTDAYLHLEKGNSSPRSTKVRHRDKPTTQVIYELRSVLNVDGNAYQRSLRKKLLHIDKQRWAQHLKHWSEQGYITLTGHRGLISKGPNFDAPRWSSGVALEPHLLVSNTHKGKFEVKCPECGNTRKVVSSKAEAEDWYKHIHLKTGMGHQ